LKDKADRAKELALIADKFELVGNQAHGQPLDRRLMNLSANETFVRVAGFIEIIYKAISAATFQAVAY